MGDIREIRYHSCHSKLIREIRYHSCHSCLPCEGERWKKSK